MLWRVGTGAPGGNRKPRQCWRLEAVRDRCGIGLDLTQHRRLLRAARAAAVRARPRQFRGAAATAAGRGGAGGGGTTTPMETLADAVRMALEQAAPDRAVGSWGHSSGVNIAGRDTRNNEEYVTMVLASLISGAGATEHMDGWNAVGPECCFGALTSGDIEILEYSYPIQIHRYGLVKDSGGAGRYRVHDIRDAYLQRIVSDVKLARPMTIAIDSGNGVAGAFAGDLYRMLGCEVIELFCDVDGTFPNHHPDPSVPENLADLIEALAKGDAEIGLAFDGEIGRASCRERVSSPV